MIGAILSFVTWLLGKLFGKPAGPSPEAVAVGQAAQATTQLQTEEATNDQLQAAAAARAAADAERVRSAGNVVTLDPKASINTDPDGHFRD